MNGRIGWVAGWTWLATALIGAWLSYNLLLTFFAVGILAFLFILCFSFLRRRTVLIAGTAMLFCLLSMLVWELRCYVPLSRLENQTVTVQGQVCDGDGDLTLRVTGGDLPKGIQLSLRGYSSDNAPEPYDFISGTFTLYGREKTGLSLQQQKASGIVGTLVIKDVSGLQITSVDVPWTATFGEWRRNTVRWIQSRLTGDEGAVVSGICLGADQNLSAQAKAAFRACGIQHLFSVSGFHLALLTEVLRRLLGRCRFPRIVRGALLGICVVFFMALVGFEPSVVRSGVLCLLVQAAVLFRRQADSLNSLGLALVLLLFGNPYAAYDAGLLLSFCATYGLLVLAPWLQNAILSRLPQTTSPKAPKWHTLLRRVVTLSCVTIAATVATLPVSVLFFKEISLISLPCNLIATLPASALMVMGSIACLLFMTGLEALAGGFLFVAGWIARFLLIFTQKISEIPLVTVAIRQVYLLLWIVGSLLLLYVGWRLYRRRGVCLTAAISIFVLSISLFLHTWFMRDVTKITVVPSKEAVTMYAQNNGRTVLVCAPQATDDLYTLRARLRSDGIRQMDVLVVYGGEAAVLASASAIWEEFLEETVLLHTVPASDLADRCKAAHVFEEGDVPLWEELSISRSGEYVVFRADKTAMAIFPKEGTFYALPRRCRDVQAVIYSGKEPDNIGNVRMITAADEPTVWMTRGKGDL